MAAQDQISILARLDRVLEILVSIAEQLDVPAARLAPAREILRADYNAWLRRQLEGLNTKDGA